MRTGFSLVELSIVLVILGLLTGGILTGQNLIRAAELRSVTTELQNYQTATQTFRDRYFHIPGDMANATDFWGAESSCPGNNTTPSTDTKTCNGNGDGNLSPIAPTSNEIFRHWQHLANAGLIEGQYTGVAASATATSPASVLGSNVPASKLGNAGWSVYWVGPVPISNTGYFDGTYGNIWFFGNSQSVNVTFYPILVPEEAWNIDIKVDDGMPATGRLVTLERDGGTASDDCSDLAPSSSASLQDSKYNLGNTTVGCALIFRKAM